MATRLLINTMERFYRVEHASRSEFPPQFSNSLFECVFGGRNVFEPFEIFDRLLDVAFSFFQISQVADDLLEDKLIRFSPGSHLLLKSIKGEFPEIAGGFGILIILVPNPA